MDTTFRTKSEHTEEVAPKASDTSTTHSMDLGVEIPFLDFERVNKHPLPVEYFNLGDRWEDGFSDEVSQLNTYLTEKVEKGDINNSISAVKKELKDLEKVNNIKDEERTVIKMGILSAYVKFLMESDGVKRNYRKYANPE